MRKTLVAFAALVAVFVLVIAVASMGGGWTWDEDAPAAHYVAGPHEGDGV